MHKGKVYWGTTIAMTAPLLPTRGTCVPPMCGWMGGWGQWASTKGGVGGRVMAPGGGTSSKHSTSSFGPPRPRIKVGKRKGARAGEPQHTEHTKANRGGAPRPGPTTVPDRPHFNPSVHASPLARRDRPHKPGNRASPRRDGEGGEKSPPRPRARQSLLLLQASAGVLLAIEGLEIELKPPAGDRLGLTDWTRPPPRALSTPFEARSRSTGVCARGLCGGCATPERSRAGKAKGASSAARFQT